MVQLPGVRGAGPDDVRLLSADRPFPGWVGVGDWTSWVNAGLEETALSALRENTLSGRPTGSKEFVRDLEMRLGRELAKPLMRRPRAVDVDRDNTEDFFGGA